MSKKTTKRALAMSFVSVFLCVCMLVGTTFAWFTDSVTSSNNVIKSGTLDVEMSWADGKTDPANTTWTDASKGAIFNNDLWEPGYTEVRHIKIENKGTLALKYQLAIIADGAVSDLAKVIDVYYVDPAVKVADRTALVDTYKLDKPLSDVLTGMSATASGDLKAGESHTVTIALKMQETADNQYQNKSLGSDFAVQLVATQLEAEIDSFDNTYDKGAAWDGVVPTTMPESLVLTLSETKNQGGTITIKDANAFVYLNNLIEDFKTQANAIPGYDNYYYHWAWNVELDADINLMDIPVNTINISYFGEGFDGNGHTISNVVMNDGQTSLFDKGSVKDLNIANIVVDAPSAKTVGAVVSTNAYLNDVHVVDATVSGGKYVGGLAGKGSSFINCSIKDSTVTATDKTVGGLVGYSIGDPDPATVSGNTVENVTVTGAYNVGGLLGQAQNETVENNIVKNVTLTSTTAVVGTDPTEVRTGEVVARNYGATVGTNTASGVTQGVVESVSTAADLKNAVDNNNTVKVDLAAGAYDTNFAVAGGKDVTIEGNGKDTVLNGQIATTASNEGTLVLRNLTINVSDAIQDSTGISQTSKSAIAIWGDQTVICENVTFNMDLANSTAITSWWDTGVGTTIIVRNCTFNCNGNRPIRATGNVTVENCTFNDPYRYAVQLTAKASTATLLDKATINFNNNTIVNGENGKAFVYGIQLEGADYGCNNCVINGAGNTIMNGGTDSAMYYCECGKVDHATITWNTEVPAVHENP